MLFRNRRQKGVPVKKKGTKKKEKSAPKVEHFAIVQLAANGEPKIWGFDGKLNKVRNKPDRIISGTIRGKTEVPAGSATTPKGSFIIVGPIRPTARKPKAMKMEGWLYKVEGKKQWIVSAAPLGGKKPTPVAEPKRLAVKAKAAPKKKK
jgi:hypothetical protein